MKNRKRKSIINLHCGTKTQGDYIVIDGFLLAEALRLTKNEQTIVKITKQ